MSFHIIRNDITKVKADAIVNTANPQPTYAGGTDHAIYMAAGKTELLKARKQIGDIARGQAVETPAFNLTAKYIIHTVGPIWNGGEDGEFDILKSCYENSLNLALKLKCKSIAFPLIATGVYGFPKDKALQIAMSVIQPFVMEHSMKVTLVVFDKNAFELSGKVVENIQEFVDSNYVKTANKREYSNDFYGSRRNLPLDAREYARSRRRRMCEIEETEDLCMMDELSSPSILFPEKEVSSKKSKDTAKSKTTAGRVDISKLIAASEKTFQEKLFEIIDERGLTGPQVYKNYISKQVYSKIQANKNYHPNKFTAIALCLSLHLDVDETKDLIGRAGWTLSPSNKADLVVTGCIMNKEFNLVNVNIILFKFDCPELQKIK